MQNLPYKHWRLETLTVELQAMQYSSEELSLACLEPSCKERLLARLWSGNSDTQEFQVNSEPMPESADGCSIQVVYNVDFNECKKCDVDTYMEVLPVINFVPTVEAKTSQPANARQAAKHIS